MSPVPATRVRAQTRCSVLVEGSVGGTRGALGGCAEQGPPHCGPGGNLVLQGGGGSGEGEEEAAALTAALGRYPGRTQRGLSRRLRIRACDSC